jgi:WD40 repeat protein
VEPWKVLTRGLFVGIDRGRFGIWSLESAMPDPFRADGEITAMAASPDGALLALATHSGSVEVVESRSRTRLVRLHTTDLGTRDVDVSPDGRRILTADRDGAMRLWDLATRRLLLRRMRESERGMAARFLPGGESAVVVWSDGTIGTWRFADDSFAPFEAQHPSPWDVAVSPDGRLAVSSGRGGALHPQAIVWDVATGRPLQQIAPGDACYGVRFSPDGAEALVGRHRDGPMIVSAAGAARLPFTPNPEVVVDSEWLPGGLVAFATLSGDLRFRDPSNGEEVASLRISEGAITELLTFGDRLALGDDAGRLVVLDLETSRRAGPTDRGLLGAARAADRGAWRLAASLFTGIDVPTRDRAAAFTATGDVVAAREAVEALAATGDLLPGTAAVWQALLESRP